MNRSILMLEHDDDDRYLTQAIFDENQIPVKVNFVTTSNDLFSYLDNCKTGKVLYPALILLNWYTEPLPIIEILRSLRAHERYNMIPRIVLSGHVDSSIVYNCYAAGAYSVIKKPSTLEAANRKILAFASYWFQTVELPN